MTQLINFAYGDETYALRKALLLLKALSSDQNLTAKIKKSGAKTTIAIIFNDADKESKAETAEIEKAFETLEKTTTVARMPILTNSLAYKNKSDFFDKISALNPVLIYVCTALGDKISIITSVSRSLSILSSSGTEQYVYGGISVGAIIQDGKPKYLINLAAARSEGTDFPVSFLRFAKVIAKQGQ